MSFNLTLALLQKDFDLELCVSCFRAGFLSMCHEQCILYWRFPAPVIDTETNQGSSDDFTVNFSSCSLSVSPLLSARLCNLSKVCRRFQSDQSKARPRGTEASLKWCSFIALELSLSIYQASSLHCTPHHGQFNDRHDFFYWCVNWSTAIDFPEPSSFPISILRNDTTTVCGLYHINKSAISDGEKRIMGKVWLFQYRLRWSDHLHDASRGHGTSGMSIPILFC